MYQKESKKSRSGLKIDRLLRNYANKQEGDLKKVMLGLVDFVKDYQPKVLDSKLDDFMKVERAAGLDNQLESRSILFSIVKGKISGVNERKLYLSSYKNKDSYEGIFHYDLMQSIDFKSELADFFSKCHESDIKDSIDGELTLGGTKKYKKAVENINQSFNQQWDSNDVSSEFENLKSVENLNQSIRQQIQTHVDGFYDRSNFDKCKDLLKLMVNYDKKDQQNGKLKDKVIARASVEFAKKFIQLDSSSQLEFCSDYLGSLPSFLEKLQTSVGKFQSTGFTNKSEKTLSEVVGRMSQLKAEAESKKEEVLSQLGKKREVELGIEFLSTLSVDDTNTVLNKISPVSRKLAVVLSCRIIKETLLLLMML